jgi:hypothetical protein
MNITKDYLNKNPTLYQYVLIPHKLFGWMWDFKELAERTGYVFFMWNDIVYHTSTGRSLTTNECDKILSDMAPLFKGSPSNCKFHEDWKKYLDEDI